jgi:hypothetical protein
VASNAALKVNRRRYLARERLMYALKPLQDGMLPAWRLVLALERAAMACGEQRERGRGQAERSRGR